jgi:hypothetical protein
MGMMRRAAYIILFVVLFVDLAAQDFKRQYQSARQHYDDGLYSLAFEGFKPLLVYDKNNPYYIYANYFYALSAYQLGYKTVSRDVLIQITKLYPEWPGLDEALVWLAKIYFERGDFFLAMQALGPITDVGVRVLSDELIREQLSNVEDRELLRMLLEEHPNNRILAELLAKRILTDFTPIDQPVVDSLMGVYQLDREKFKIPDLSTASKKEKYVVSMLVPFLANTIQPTPQPKPNQSILQLYQGMKVAVDSLKAAGLPIELRAYDTERNIEKLKALLALDELKNSDLIVGPLFPEEYGLVRQFSLANKINMINPVTNNSEYVGGNPFATLFQPSFETLGRKSATWVAENVKNKNCLVYYGESVRDSVLAFNFIKEALRAGVQVRLAQEVRKETAFQIVTALASPTEFDEFRNPTQFTLKRDSIGSIFVATDDPLIYTKVVNSVQTRDDSTQIVGSESWINSESNAISLENFERLRIVVWSPNYYPAQSSEYLAFARKFVRRHAQFPTQSARIGYEFMMIYGSLLHRHGAYFQPGLLREGAVKGPFQELYELGAGQDNLQVPFVRLVEGDFTPVGTRINP